MHTVFTCQLHASQQMLPGCQQEQQAKLSALKRLLAESDQKLHDALVRLACVRGCLLST